MIEDDLAGLIDGPTSEEIQLNAGLTVFDVSLLPEEGPALPIVLTIVSTWLANTLYRQVDPVPTTLLIEEAWHTVQGSVAAVTRRNTKLSRALSLSCQFAFHHISDIPADSPAIAMIVDAHVIPRACAQVIPQGVGPCSFSSRWSPSCLSQRSGVSWSAGSWGRS